MSMEPVLIDLDKIEYVIEYYFIAYKLTVG